MRAKIKPSYNDCCTCLDIQIDGGMVLDCHECSGIKECKIMSFGHGFWVGDYAMVVVDGKIEKVPASRLFDISEE